VPAAAELSLRVALSKGALPVGGNALVRKKFQESCMKWNNVSLLLLLAVLISACDSQQPTYSASNANSAPPPPAPPVAPAAPVAEAPKPDAPTAPPVRPQPQGARATAAVPANQLVRARPMPAQADPVPPVDAFGIGSCDDYISRYRACVNAGAANNTIPMGPRTHLIKGLNVQVRQWKAEVAAGKSNGLVTACAEADRSARPELVKVGCTSF
jgi:hypothetical protein